MAAERDLELLDDYLGNRMDESSRAAFEQKINADQALKGEYELQQQMISGIKKMRAAELKGMLNNIPVPVGNTTGTAVGTKVALWVAVAGLVATGIYFYVDEPSTDKASTPIESTPKVVDENPSSTKEEETAPSGQNHEDSPVVSTQESASEQKPVAPPKPGKKAATQEASREIEVYDPSEELKESNNDQVANVIANGQASDTPSIAVEIDTENRKYNFHYQFKAGKLFLYGPFEKDLYEIMEFFNAEKRTLFLYYKDNYYLLKDNTSTLKALNPIEDGELLNKLKEYRNK